MNKVRVSIIIPVYNMERYLRDCVNSVIKQSYKDYEIILVDDGSKDSSPQLCDELSSKDNRIKVIHKENEGLSMARNDGLAIAKGEFVLFLDSDDFWINDNDLQRLISFAENVNFDFTYIEFNRCRYFPSTGQFFKCPLFPKDLSNGADSSSVIMSLVGSGVFPMSACTKLLNRSFLVNNNISFIKGVFSEDTPWFMEILRYANQPIYYINNYMYGNRAEVGTSLTSTFSVSKYKGVLDIIKSQLDLIRFDKFKDSVKFALTSFLAYMYCILLGQYGQYKKSLTLELLKETQQLNYLLQYDYHPKVKKVKRVYSIFGFELTTKLLSFYSNNRSKMKNHIHKKD